MILTKLYEQINNDKAKLNPYYNVFMLIVIILSLINLVFKTYYTILKYVDYLTVSIFIIDYILRWITSNYSLKKGFKSYIIYPFTPLAIIDLLSIIPTFNIIPRTFKIFRAFRITKLLRGLRLLRIFRISRELQLL